MSGGTTRVAPNERQTDAQNRGDRRYRTRTADGARIRAMKSVRFAGMSDAERDDLTVEVPYTRRAFFFFFFFFFFFARSRASRAAAAAATSSPARGRRAPPPPRLRA